jgi:hypothetical protein
MSTYHLLNSECGSLWIVVTVPTLCTSAMEIQAFVRRTWAVYHMLKRDDWKRISFLQSTTQQTM